ncbi:MAG: dipeptidase PepV [Clostridiales bacterium]|nr:dipeptidase PepV [Eubacteriales bacterium]MDD7122501.1 dipeptidase PepV [Clostridiales bacterium]MDY5468945.1 dipeptidase PepV [Eubacteriales bacterium]
MDAKLNAIIESMHDEMIDTLQKWIRVPSVKGEAAPGAPFGKEVRSMLDMALADCEQMGFKTQNFDGYIAHADLGEGSDEDALAILAHLDVVPEGDGWKYPPYGAVIENGRMYGRGTSDDKGPAVAALYAMKAVKDVGIPLRRKVRLILGCDEESGWEDIAHYNKVATMPRMGFSPDASYPIINIEKGICRLELHGVLSNEGLQVIAFNNGERPNVIPGRASALVAGDAATVAQAEAAAKKLDIPAEVQLTDKGVSITVTGISGHAAYPETARNANGEMLLLLRELGVQGDLRLLADKIGLDYKGEGLEISVSDGISGYLTCNLGIIRAGEGGVYATLDIRYPVMTNPDMIIKNVSASLPGMRVEAMEVKEPHHVPAGSELVQNLLDAYHEVTGYERKCLYTGGGTYARSLQEGVAFGASFPQDEDLAHQANEYADIEGLYKNIKIFALAIVKLAGKA